MAVIVTAISMMIVIIMIMIITSIVFTIIFIITCTYLHFAVDFVLMANTLCGYKNLFFSLQFHFQSIANNGVVE